MTQPLSKKLESTTNDKNTPKPEFFNLSIKEDEQSLEQILNDLPHTKVIDTYEQQLLEYFVLNNPPLHLNPPERDKQFNKYRDDHYGKSETSHAGLWVYLPWRHTLLHVLEDEAYQIVRTGRNRNLITAEEQVKYYNSTIGIGGMSVGNSVALSIVQTGGCKNMKLADPDTLELTNLNRIRSSVAELTEPKVFMTARQIYELDPFANLTLYTEGITLENIDEFFAGLDIVVDEIDNLELKIYLRQNAKKNKIPLASAVDNGDSGIIDIERHDKDDNIAPFHGRAGDDIADQVVGKNLPLPIVGKLIGEKLVGFDVTEPRMQQSLLEIGKSIPTWPQLGGAALLNGAVMATTVRKILTDQPIFDNRAILSMPSMIEPDYDGEKQTAKRAQGTEKFIKQYNEAINQFLKHFGTEEK